MRSTRSTVKPPVAWSTPSSRAAPNSLSGAIGVYLLPKGWASAYRRTDTFQGSSNQESTSQVDIGLSIGGPIVKDKVFYFIAYNPVTIKDEFSIEDQLIVPSQVPPSYAYPGFATAGQTIKHQRKSDNYAGKLTWYLNPNHRIEGTVFGDPFRTGPWARNAPSIKSRR